MFICPVCFSSTVLSSGETFALLDIWLKVKFTSQSGWSDVEQSDISLKQTSVLIQILLHNETKAEKWVWVKGWT